MGRGGVRVIDRYTLSGRSDAKKVSLVRGSAREAQVARSSLGVGQARLLLTCSWRSDKLSLAKSKRTTFTCVSSSSSLIREETPGPRWCNGRGA
jgi:hypothetical protein